MSPKINIPQLLEKEILEAKISTKAEKKAFINGMLTGSGYLFKQQDKSGIIIEVSSFELAHKTAGLIQHITNHFPIIYENKTTSNLNDKTIYIVEILNENAIQLLMFSGQFNDQINTFKSINIDDLKNDTSKKAFLQGLFASSGSIYVPQNIKKPSGGYSLEIVVKNTEISKEIKALLKYFDIRSNSRTKNNVVIIYIKDAEIILDFLIIIGAVNTYFELQNILALRMLTNDTNRERNCMVANITKTAKASAKQLLAIQTLIQNEQIDNLNPKLKSTALARLQHPDLPLSELAKILEDKPSKSGLAHRLNKIVEFANQQKIKQ